jgi:hypothetical protein
VVEILLKKTLGCSARPSFSIRLLRGGRCWHVLQVRFTPGNYLSRPLFQFTWRKERVFCFAI